LGRFLHAHNLDKLIRGCSCQNLYFGEQSGAAKIHFIGKIINGKITVRKVFFNDLVQVMKKLFIRIIVGNTVQGYQRHA